MTVLVLIGLGATAASDCCWCDKATPSEAKTIKASDGLDYSLIFSDEFDTKDRDFTNGKDTKWTALNIGDTSNMGVAFYLPDQAKVANDPEFPAVSALRIETANKSHVGDSPVGEKGIYMPYSSAMLQSWNKFCFTGGVVEFRARQPIGGGYWPALWLFGNLGRAVYQNSNTGLWPWSYDECDADLELPPTDPPQKISACMDHDLKKDGLHAFQGRGATELDVLEGAVSNTGKGSYVVGSLQLSPGVPAFFRPPLFGYPTTAGAGSWYTDLKFGPDGKPNNGWYGPPWGSGCPTGCPDALSGGITERDDLHTRYWTYRMEWIPGPDGRISWYYDGDFVWGMDGNSFGDYKVCAESADSKDCHRTPPRMIPQEPMSLVMNTAIGTWNGGQTAIDGKHWPAMFYIDYVRVWQNELNVGCNPPDFPTKTYIEKNKDFFGEWSTPVGYDTCPEIYPPSAYDNAAKIVARAEAVRLAAKAGKSGPTAVGAVLAAFKAAPTTTAAAAAQAVPTTASTARSSSGFSFFSPMAMAGVAVLVAGGFLAGRATASPAYTPAVTEELGVSRGEYPSAEYQLRE